MKKLSVVILTVALLPAFCAHDEESSLACAAKGRVMAAETSCEVADDLWRYTVNGWERKSSWPNYLHQRPKPDTRVPLHPAVVASFQFFVSLGGLLAFNSRWDSEVSSKAESE